MNAPAAMPLLWQITTATDTLVVTVVPACTTTSDPCWRAERGAETGMGESPRGAVERLAQHLGLEGAAIAECAPPSVSVADLAYELLAQKLHALGALLAAAIVAVGDLALVQLARGTIATEVWAATQRSRASGLTLRTLHLLLAGEYAAVVDVLEAHATRDCEDCWEVALDQRDFALCPGCCARAESDAPVVDEALIIVDDEPAADVAGDESRPGVVRCETAAERFYACLSVVTLPGQAVTLWREMRDELTATERAAARTALDQHVGRVGRMQRPAQWIDRAMMEPSAARGAR